MISQLAKLSDAANICWCLVGFVFSSYSNVHHFAHFCSKYLWGSSLKNQFNCNQTQRQSFQRQRWETQHCYTQVQNRMTNMSLFMPSYSPECQIPTLIMCQTIRLTTLLACFCIATESMWLSCTDEWADYKCLSHIYMHDSSLMLSLTSLQGHTSENMILLFYSDNGNGGFFMLIACSYGFFLPS